MELFKLFPKANDPDICPVTSNLKLNYNYLKIQMVTMQMMMIIYSLDHRWSVTRSTAQQLTQSIKNVNPNVCDC